MKRSIDLHFYENSALLKTELIESAKKLSTPLLSDVMGCFGGMDYSIKPLTPGLKMVGTAITVNLRAGDNLFLHKALYSGNKGYVLVIDGKGCTTNAPFGEILTTAAMAIGLEGIVLDGVVRDVSAIRKSGFPVFSKGSIPTGGDKDGPGEINVPISCGGVAVHPGDLVMGDDDGVVIVPRNRIKEILTLAKEKAIQEEKRLKDIKEGRLEPSWLSSKLERYKI